jgi:hypothetical protein
MLSINPRMLPRLDELEADLRARRQRAIAVVGSPGPTLDTDTARAKPISTPRPQSSSHYRGLIASGMASYTQDHGRAG